MSNQGLSKEELIKLFNFGHIFKRFFPKEHRSKGNYVCPFHHDTDPSLTPYADHGFCHGGCERGHKNIFDIYMLATGSDFASALKYFREQSGSVGGESTYKPTKKVVCAYVYSDEKGDPLFRVIRQQSPKTFPQERWNGEKFVGGKECMRGVRRVLWHLKAIIPEEHVCLCEGEKDVETLERLGFPATTAPEGGKKDTWKRFCDEWKIYEPLLGKRVTIFEDNDDTGRDHVRDICATFINHKIPYRVIRFPELKVHGDVTDWIEAGHTAEELRKLIEDIWSKPLEEPWQLNPIDGLSLYNKEFPPIKEVIKDVLYEGLTLLGAQPKAGKTFLAFQAAISISRGEFFLSKFEVDQGDCLYIAMQDGERRLCGRLRNIIPEEWKDDLGRLQVQDFKGVMKLSADPADIGLIKQMEHWVSGVKDPRLIVIDTLQDVRADGVVRRGAYSQDVSDITPLQKFAEQYRIAVMLVHHTKKKDKKHGEADDWMELMSGTNGVSGSCDHIMLIDRKRGHPQATLKLDGRDDKSKEYLIQQGEKGGWTCLGEAATVKDDTLKGRIYAALRKCGEPMTRQEICAEIEANKDVVSNALAKMAKEFPPRVAKGVRLGTWVALELTMEGI